MTCPVGVRVGLGLARLAPYESTIRRTLQAVDAQDLDQTASNARTATGIQVPPGVVADLGNGKRPAVTVTINGGHTYRSTVAVRGGRYLVGVSAENRAKAGVAAGDLVDVELELDTALREVAVPDDLAAALDADTRRRFDAMSYSGRLRHVLAVEGARTDATRQRRIAAVLTAMREDRVEC